MMKPLKTKHRTLIDFIDTGTCDSLDISFMPRNSVVWWKCIDWRDVHLGTGQACKLVHDEYVFSPHQTFDVLLQIGTYAVVGKSYVRGKVFIHDQMFDDGSDSQTLYLTVPNRNGNELVLDKGRVLFEPVYGSALVNEVYPKLDLMDKRKSLWGDNK